MKRGELSAREKAEVMSLAESFHEAMVATLETLSAERGALHKPLRASKV